MSIRAATNTMIECRVKFVPLEALNGRSYAYFPVGIAAGFPSPAADHKQKSLTLDDRLITHPAATYFADVDGHSMSGLHILDGDLLVIDKSLEPTHDDIVIAMLNDEFVCKQLYKRGGKVKLLSANPDYPPIEITDEMDATIWGVVIHVIHTPKKKTSLRR